MADKDLTIGINLASQGDGGKKAEQALASAAKSAEKVEVALEGAEEAQKRLNREIETGTKLADAFNPGAGLAGGRATVGKPEAAPPLTEEGFVAIEKAVAAIQRKIEVQTALGQSTGNLEAAERRLVNILKSQDGQAIAAALALRKLNEEAEKARKPVNELAERKRALRDAARGLAAEVPLLGRAFYLLTSPVAIAAGVIGGLIAVVLSSVNAYKASAQGMDEMGDKSVKLEEKTKKLQVSIGRLFVNSGLDKSLSVAAEVWAGWLDKLSPKVAGLRDKSISAADATAQYAAAMKAVGESAHQANEELSRMVSQIHRVEVAQIAMIDLEKSLAIAKLDRAEEKGADPVETLKKKQAVIAAADKKSFEVRQAARKQELLELRATEESKAAEIEDAADRRDAAQKKVITYSKVNAAEARAAEIKSELGSTYEFAKGHAADTMARASAATAANAPIKSLSSSEYRQSLKDELASLIPLLPEVGNRQQGFRRTATVLAGEADKTKEDNDKEILRLQREQRVKQKEFDDENRKHGVSTQISSVTDETAMHKAVGAAAQNAQREAEAALQAANRWAAEIYSGVSRNNSAIQAALQRLLDASNGSVQAVVDKMNQQANRIEENRTQ